MLLQDTQLIETLAHFSRERIPERYVDPARYVLSIAYFATVRP
jgi:catalase